VLAENVVEPPADTDVDDDAASEVLGTNASGIVPRICLAAAML